MNDRPLSRRAFAATSLVAGLTQARGAGACRRYHAKLAWSRTLGWFKKAGV